MTDAEFRELITRTLTCRIDARAKCADAMETFLSRCFYQAGAYDQCVLAAAAAGGRAAAAAGRKRPFFAFAFAFHCCLRRPLCWLASHLPDRPLKHSTDPQTS
jgi:hypothetical protein